MYLVTSSRTTQLKMSWLVNAVRFLHWSLIAFIIIVPFTGNEWLLAMHAVMIPGIVIHWITNNNMCSLSYIEAKLTNQPMNSTFISKVLHPFFEINNEMIYASIIGLWLFGLYQLRQTDFRLIRLSFYIIWYVIKSTVGFVVNGVKSLVGL